MPEMFGAFYGLGQSPSQSERPEKSVCRYIIRPYYFLHKRLLLQRGLMQAIAYTFEPCADNLSDSTTVPPQAQGPPADPSQPSSPACGPAAICMRAVLAQGPNSMSEMKHINKYIKQTHTYVHMCIYSYRHLQVR